MSEEKPSGVWNYYRVNQEKKQVELKRRKCPRCGSLMALHEQGKRRYYCGKCHYTEFV